jgi:hypothetical protein
MGSPALLGVDAMIFGPMSTSSEGTAASTFYWVIGTIDQDQMQNLAIR